MMELSAGTRIMILAPLVRGRKGEHKDVFESIRKLGFLRARVDGTLVDVNAPPTLVAQKTHNIEAVIDRVVVREGIRPRIAESINLAVQHSDGLVLAAHEEKNDYRQRLARSAVQHAIRLPELQNQLRGVGAANVQLQQSLWSVSEVRRAWGQRGLRS